MKSSYLALDYRCNHNCMICPLSTADKMHRALTLDEVKDNIEKNCIGEGDHLVLSGGEPCLSPYIFDCLEYLTNRGIHITMLTNCSQFVRSEFLDRVEMTVDKHKFDVVTAIHSMDAALHNKITGTEGSLATSIEAVEQLVGHGFHLTVKHIVNRLCITSLPQLAEEICRRFPPSVEFQLTAMDFCGRASKNQRLMFVTFEEAQPYIEKALDIFEGERQRRRLTLLEFPFCGVDPYFWKYFAFANKNINLYSAPNVNKNEERYIVYEQTHCHTVKACEDCVIQDTCAGVWESAFRLGGENLVRPIRKEKDIKFK